MNVFVIVTDSMRKDAIGVYGSNVETPHLDSLARDGTIFTNAFSEGLPTLPTRTTWWTGRYTFPTRGWQPFELSDLLLARRSGIGAIPPALFQTHIICTNRSTTVGEGLIPLCG